jgi:hypothetical protein
MRTSILALALLTGCAPRLILPPIAEPPAQPERGAPFRTALPPIPSEAARVSMDQDTVLGFQRLAVTTHRGAYTGWVQRPQLTFFALMPLRPSPSPLSTIGLVLRTLEPDALLGTTLSLACPAQAATMSVAAQSKVVPTGNTQSHFLTYWLPVERVADFAKCESGVLAVGQITVHSRKPSWAACVGC